MEAASQRTGIPRFSYEQIAARFPQSQLPALSSRRRTRAPQRVLSVYGSGAGADQLCVVRCGGSIVATCETDSSLPYGLAMAEWRLERCPASTSFLQEEAWHVLDWVIAGNVCSPMILIRRRAKATERIGATSTSILPMWPRSARPTFPGEPILRGGHFLAKTYR